MDPRSLPSGYLQYNYTHREPFGLAAYFKSPEKLKFIESVRPLWAQNGDVMKPDYKKTIFVGFAFFLISAFWQAYDAIVPLVLTNHFGLVQWASGAVMSLDNVIAVFMLPIFGAISDKINSRYGKRTPFIFIGTVLAVLLFILLAIVDTAQVANIGGTSIPDAYAAAEAIRDNAYELIDKGQRAEGLEMLKQADKLFEAVRAETFAITSENLGLLIGFISVLLLLLISMATFRSPAVALMPDVTVKPLRSKGNAIINLMGTAGGIIVLVLGMVFATSKKLFSSYVGYVIAVVSVMAVGLIVFLLTVKEKKWAREMEEDTAKYGLEAPVSAEDTASKRRLSRSERKSLVLILSSVALWYIGYNSITSKYSVYATNELGFDYNLTLIIAQVAAIISYIPVGILSSKIGRKKSILAGIVMLTTAFLLGNFITPNSPEALMYPIFVLAGIGWASINVNSFPMVVELAKGGDVGKYTGYYYTASMAAQIVAPLLSGLLYTLFTMRLVFFAFGTVFVALSFATMFFVRHGDSTPESRGVLESLDVDGE